MVALIFGPVKFINLFKRVFSDHSIKEIHAVCDWDVDWWEGEEKQEICKYFHPWQPIKTEKVEDELVMLKYYKADEDYRGTGKIKFRRIRRLAKRKRLHRAEVSQSE